MVRISTTFLIIALSGLLPACKDAAPQAKREYAGLRIFGLDATAIPGWCRSHRFYLARFEGPAAPVQDGWYARVGYLAANASVRTEDGPAAPRDVAYAHWATLLRTSARSPDLAGMNAGWLVLLRGPGRAGTWRIAGTWTPAGATHVWSHVEFLDDHPELAYRRPMPCRLLPPRGY